MTKERMLELQHAAYAADDAWSAELTRLYGRKADDARYGARGFATDNLNRLKRNFLDAMDLYSGACSEYRHQHGNTYRQPAKLLAERVTDLLERRDQDKKI